MKSVHVLRKPCSRSAPTVAANVLRWGTGGLNIDAARIYATDTVGKVWVRGGNQTGASLTTNTTGLHQYIMANPAGRWPANLVLQHLDGCVQDGVKKVKVIGATEHRKDHGTKGLMGWEGQPHAGFRDPDGTETVTAWVCAPGCPVKGSFPLDGRSTKPSASGVSTRNKGASLTGMGGIDSNPSYFDAGSASRFFKQVGGRSE